MVAMTGPHIYLQQTTAALLSLSHGSVLSCQVSQSPIYHFGLEMMLGHGVLSPADVRSQVPRHPWLPSQMGKSFGLLLVLWYLPFSCILTLSVPSPHLSPHTAPLGCCLPELFSQSFGFSLVGGDSLLKLDLESPELFRHGGDGGLGIEGPLGFWEAGLQPDCQAMR